MVDHFEASSQSDAERIFLERTDLHHFYDDDVIAEWKSLYEEGFLSIGNPLFCPFFLRASPSIAGLYGSSIKAESSLYGQGGIGGI